MTKPSGTVYLCKNAIVDRNYSHTITFRNPSEQQTYWGSLIKYSITDVTYVRRQRQYIRVDYNLDELKDVNYLFYRAAEGSKLYYCFVTGKEYFSDNTTYVYFETDVLQTYMFDYTVKPSYVLQEHCDRWDANHKPIYSRTDEGLDYGSEYTVESAYKIASSDKAIQWYLAICLPHNMLVSEGFNAKEPSQVLSPNPYIFYLIPDRFVKVTYTNAEGGSVEDKDISNIYQFMELMGNSELGTFVKQIVKLPYSPFDFTQNDTNITITDSDLSLTHSSLQYNETIAFTYLRVHYLNITDYFTFKNMSKALAEMDIFEGIDSALPTNEQWEEVVKNPYTTERDKRFESKLLTHPYRYNLLTDWRNTPIIVKNEYIGGDKIKVNYLQSISFNGAARYWIEGYKKDPEGRNSSLTQIIQEDCPVVVDQYYEYMLANKNQITANQTNAMANLKTGVATNLVGGIMSGNARGGVTSAITGAIGGSVNYQNMIRSENAKQSDIKNLPDTIISSNDGTFNAQDDNRYVTFYRYKICCEFEELLADTFAMTGYTVKRVKVPNLKTRARYNYVRTVGANIVGSFDQDDLSIIRNIFDNGVTFWHYNTVNFKPLDYSLENIETKLLKE